MHQLTQRLKQLPDMQESLLVRLAQSNPTPLQLELLDSVPAVKQFLNTPYPVIRELDDETLAQLALLDPTRDQMRFLCTPGAIKRFIELSNGVGVTTAALPPAEKNPVSMLNELIVPMVPTYVCTFLDDTKEFHCECRVDENRITSGGGSTKRAAKAAAAVAMLELLRPSL